MPLQIDINCDLGEGYGIEEAIAPYISSANIACGGHAGDMETMRQTIQICKRYGITAGAHPSYPDREHFGRKVLDISWEKLKESLQEQILQIKKIADEEGLSLHHIKLHGAIYNKAAVDAQLSKNIIELISEIDKTILLYGLPDCELEKQARQQQINYICEGFGDRTYQDDGQLTPRSMEGALIENELESIGQVLKMIIEKMVTSLSGKKVPMPVQTICLHGDGKHAVDFAKSLREALRSHEIKMEAPPSGK